MPATGFDDARHTILTTARPLPTGKVAIAHALGRVAAVTAVGGYAPTPIPKLICREKCSLIAGYFAGNR